MSDLDKYQKFYKYTDSSKELASVASKLFSKLNPQNDGLLASKKTCHYISERIWDRSVSPPVPRKKAKTLLESRFTKASVLIKEPMASCGAVSTLVASILRHGGYAVRLVHGDLPQSDQHAWNEIWLPNKKIWHAFDCSSGRGKSWHLTERHKKILDCADWSEIEALLIEEHKKNLGN